MDGSSLKISFIIIEYNCLNNAEECASSIREKCKNVSHEIIITSNSNYPIEKREFLSKAFPEIKWIFNENNLGFARAMNRGIVAASGEIITVINPDVRIRDGSIFAAYNYLNGNEDVGIIGPQIVDSGGNLQDSCRKFMTLSNFLNRLAQRLILKKDVILNKDFNYTKVQPVDWVIGAFMMLKRDALKKVGLLDEDYFLYVEDMDWCKRFWDNGYKVVYYPDLVIQYKGDRKSIIPLMLKGLVNKYTVYHFKSYLRFVRKHRLNFYNNQRV